MGTIITTSDGQAIVLNSDLRRVVGQVADALDRKASTEGEQMLKLPRGFCQFHTEDGRELVVNAEQIAWIGRPEEAPATPAKRALAYGVVPGR